MPLPAAVLPDRAMVFPFAAVLFPVLWFVYRDATGVEGIANSLPRLLGSVAAAVVVSYVVAGIASAAIGPASESASGSLKPPFAPSNATIAAVTFLSALLGTSLFADAIVDVSRWLTTVLAPFGVAVG